MQVARQPLEHRRAGHPGEDPAQRADGKRQDPRVGHAERPGVLVGFRCRRSKSGRQVRIGVGIPSALAGDLLPAAVAQHALERRAGMTGHCVWRSRWTGRSTTPERRPRAGVDGSLGVQEQQPRDVAVTNSIRHRSILLLQSSPSPGDGPPGCRPGSRWIETRPPPPGNKRSRQARQNDWAWVRRSPDSNPRRAESRARRRRQAVSDHRSSPASSSGPAGLESNSPGVVSSTSVPWPLPRRGGGPVERFYLLKQNMPPFTAEAQTLLVGERRRGGCGRQCDFRVEGHARLEGQEAGAVDQALFGAV